jgi:hypothetical protein
MAKFEFSNYAKIWSAREGRQIVDMIMNESGLIKPNYTYWRERFRVDPATTPVDQQGRATFTSTLRSITSGDLMDMRAPLADTRQAEKPAEHYYTGMIPDFAPAGFKETALERYYKEKEFEQFGDVAIVARYATEEIQRMMDSANMTLSYLGAKVNSTGSLIYEMGEGIKSAIYKPAIPAANFVKAGAKVWSDPEAKIITQMIEIEKAKKDEWGVEMPMVWEISEAMFNSYFLGNAEVKEWVRFINSSNGILLPEGYPMTAELVEKALAQYPGLSPIVIASEKQKDVAKGTVSGWNEGNAVLRPAGYVGYIRHANVLDKEIFEKYGNTVNSYNFTPVLGGLGTLLNSVCVNGNFKEWHTDLFVKAIPSLDEFLYHVVVDTTTANS